MSRRLVITGGGTGGHVFPGLALAAELKRLRPELEIRWIGSHDRLEARLVPEAGIPFTGIRVRGLRGMNVARTVAGAALLPLALAGSIREIASLRPDLVVGVGGYVSGPVVAAARLLGHRTVIHEQNVVPGWTNRVLGRLADRVLVSFPETSAGFPAGKLRVTGNPIREEALGGEREPAVEGVFRILVLGGSQGSRSLNRMVARAVGMVEAAGLEIVHQTGAADLDAVRPLYDGVKARVELTPFISGIGRWYRWADIVICRAGATTLAELAANGCPAILVPYGPRRGGRTWPSSSSS
jgi:UDP-N-acetylglucosamine--N-acetylmuramyl-(pentapeptide) pyrophosphoryl-undecaprenol N-acetylglucosamine transferase